MQMNFDRCIFFLSNFSKLQAHYQLNESTESLKCFHKALFLANKKNDFRKKFKKIKLFVEKLKFWLYSSNLNNLLCEDMYGFLNC